MALSSTTPIAIRSSLITAIEGMTPSTTNYQGHAWRYLDEGEVHGPEIRTFTILHEPAVEYIEGVHGGDGIEYAYEMRIRVAYGGLTGDEFDELCWADGKDLWLLMHPLPDGGAGAIAGLLPFRGTYLVEYPDQGDEDGYRLVDFIYEVHFKAADS